MKGRVEWATEWWPTEETKGEAEATEGAAWWMAQSANAMAVFTGFTKKAIFFSYMGHELICFIVKKFSHNTGLFLVCKSLNNIECPQSSPNLLASNIYLL